MTAENFSWTRDAVLWAAGLFEGEGCLHKRKSAEYGRKYKPDRLTWRLVMSSTDFDVIDRFQKVFGVGKVYGPYSRAGRPQCKPIWHWRVAGVKEIYAVCVAIYPFMGARRSEKFMEFFEYFKKPRPMGRPHGLAT